MLQRKRQHVEFAKKSSILSAQQSAGFVVGDVPNRDRKANIMSLAMRVQFQPQGCDGRVLDRAYAYWGFGCPKS